MQNIIDVYLYAYGNAAQNYDCEQGPAVLKKRLEKKQNNFQWHKPLQVSNHKQQHDALLDVARLCAKLGHDTKHSIANHHFFMTLGGDHSCAIGSWSGALNTLDGDLGLIWFDAHMDSHTFETTPSNNIH